MYSLSGVLDHDYVRANVRVGELIVIVYVMGGALDSRGQILKVLDWFGRKKMILFHHTKETARRASLFLANSLDDRYWSCPFESRSVKPAVIYLIRKVLWDNRHWTCPDSKLAGQTAIVYH